MNLIDDACDNYRPWQLSGDIVSYNNWANQFKFKLLSTLNQWLENAGATAANLLRNLRDKAQQ